MFQCIIQQRNGWIHAPNPETRDVFPGKMLDLLWPLPFDGCRANHLFMVLNYCSLITVLFIVDYICTSKLPRNLYHSTENVFSISFSHLNLCVAIEPFSCRFPSSFATRQLASFMLHSAWLIQLIIGIFFFVARKSPLLLNAHQSLSFIERRRKINDRIAIQSILSLRLKYL